MRTIRRLWADERGALLAVEWTFVVTLLVLGLIVGLKSVQAAVVGELEEVAAAVGALSQSYGVGGVRGCCAFTAGSFYFDRASEAYPISACTPIAETAVSACAD